MNNSVANRRYNDRAQIDFTAYVEVPVNKCNARNAYPANHKTSVTDTSICSSILKAK